MAKSPTPNWAMLPDIIFSDVMMRIVLEGFESLHRCRQVCKSWNERIMSNIWDNSTKKDTLFTISFWLQMQKTLLSKSMRSIFFFFLLVNL